MEALRVRVHSIVDVITNSSTTVYTACHSNTVASVKGIISAILKAAGSDKTVEELFIVGTVLGASALSRAEDMLADEMSEDIEWEEKWKKAKEEIAKMKKEGILAKYVEDRYKDENGMPLETVVVITPKVEDPEVQEALDKINDLFTSDACYNG